MSQTERLYWLDAQIRDARFPSAQDVAERFEVSLRTAYKDRDYLIHRLNAPLQFDRNRRGWAYADDNYALPFLALSAGDAAALRRTMLAAQEYLGPAEASPLGVLIDRLGRHLPQDATPHDHVSGGIHLISGISAELAQACRQAVERRQRMRLLYYSANRDELTERTVRPYDLLNWRGETHMVAWCEWRQDFRQFFLGRIREWTLLEPDAAFARDESFDIAAYLSKGLDIRHGEDLETVKVRFSPYQARWVRERIYHPSQTIEELPDGGLLMTLTVAGTEEARRWLLSFGAEAEVLEPASLRAEIAAIARNLVNLYDVTWQ